MTIEIAVCDDQPEVTERLERLLRQYFREYGPDYDFRFLFFRTPPEVFAYLEHDRIHILFMDLKFDTADEDGMLWTKRIKDAFPQVLVMILTGYEQRCKEGYKAGAFRFMTKPLSEQEFTENLNDCMKEITGKREVWVKSKGLKFLLPVGDILFIEAYAGESRVYVKDHVFGSDRTLADWEKALEEDFFRINKSLLIPFSQVAELSVGKHEALMADGSRFSVSRRKWTSFRSRYLRYISMPSFR